MSASCFALIKFNDGTIKYCSYSGIADYCSKFIHNDYRGVWEEWDKKYNLSEPLEARYARIAAENKIRCRHRIHERVVVMVMNNLPYYWKGLACRKCNLLVDGIERHPSNGKQQKVRYYNPAWAKKILSEIKEVWDKEHRNL